MRLYDKLLAQRGQDLDIVMSGAITKLYPDLVKAQCFQMSAEIACTCAEVCRSKPSSIVSALDLIRAPYPRTWIEWSPSEREGNRFNGKPVPKHVGALLVTDNKCQEGYAALAWEHIDGSIMLNPLGIGFNWERGGPTAVELYARKYNFKDADKIIREKKEWIRKTAEASKLPERWERYSDIPEEREAAIELEFRASIIPLEVALDFLQQCGIMPGTSHFESYCEDLAGELPFIEGFLLLLNSRNSIVDQKRDDFTKLNRAREKNRKTPLREFINTRIKMNRVQSNRAASEGYTRETARRHIVRGHFKVRASGVYWWSPHTRNKHRMTVKRAEYTIV